ncbi:hypothetical protein [Streptomyces sp. NPDC001657]|uniref:hypothetical protein n=1 Tax=Streptomyces sp. NPDC001657 TaxID=3154522 RepID=UPI00332F35C6
MPTHHNRPEGPTTYGHGGLAQHHGDAHPLQERHRRLEVAQLAVRVHAVARQSLPGHVRVVPDKREGHAGRRAAALAAAQRVPPLVPWEFPAAGRLTDRAVQNREVRGVPPVQLAHRAGLFGTQAHLREP